MPSQLPHEKKKNVKEELVHDFNKFKLGPKQKKEIDNSIKNYNWEVKLTFPNSKLRYKIPIVVRDKLDSLISQTGLLKINIFDDVTLYGLDEIRLECAKWVTNKRSVEICLDRNLFIEFVRFALKYIEELDMGIIGGPHNSTIQGCVFYGNGYDPNADEFTKTSIYPPYRLACNELKKYIVIFGCNRIPILTEKLVDDGVITLYKVGTSGKCTKGIIKKSEYFYKVIRGQAYCLSKLASRDGRRVFDYNKGDFKNSIMEM